MKKIYLGLKNYFKTMPGGMRIILTATVLLGAVILTSHLALGKYVKRDSRPGELVVGAKLADSFKLVEHEAVRNEDGSYTLDSALVTSNTYKLIPGLTIPKDPYIAISTKTPIKAYLYLEVIEEEISSKLSYEINDTDWTLLSGLTGPHGGAVYAYRDGLLIDNLTPDLDHISILKDNSFSLSRTPVTGTSEALRFCGYLVQPTETDTTAAEAFNGKFSEVTP